MTNAAAIPFQMLSEPSKAFSAVREKSHVWLPLTLMVLGSVLVLYWYFATVDFAWMVERMAASRPGMTDAQREAMQAAMSPGVMMWSSIAGAALGMPAMFAVSALYYHLAGKFLGSDIRYGKWFAFVVWTNLPTLLSILLMAFQVATSGGRLMIDQLSMTSLNALVFNLPMEHQWAGLLNSLDLTLLLSIPLAVIGLRAWTGRSLSTCITIAVLPYLVVYGVWAAIIQFV